METDIQNYFGSYKMYMDIKDVPVHQEVVLVFSDEPRKEDEDGERSDR